MSNNDPRIETILSALEKYSTSLGQQLAFNQQTDQRFAALINRLDQFETRFNNLEALMKQPTNSPSSVSHHLSTSQSKSESQSVDPSANVDASDSDKPQPAPSKTTWASIASKPPAPLTDRKRQALHRFFNPPVTEPNQNGSYSFVYLPRSRRMNRNQIRSKFRAISIDNLRILDLNFPARNTIGVLLHEAYLPEFQSKLLGKIDSHLIQDFDPLDHHHIADSKYQDLSEERRTQLAKALHQDRCIRTLYYFIRPHLLPGVAKYFIRQGWVSNHAAQDIINQRLPRPTKRRPGPHSTVAQTLQASQASDLPVPPSSNTPISAPQIPPTPILQDWFGNPVSTQDMDITPDFASNASASEGSRSSSPISDAVDFSQ
ncbi:hypothetical protein PS15p_209571 [Mucor circinelloides]